MVQSDMTLKDSNSETPSDTETLTALPVTDGVSFYSTSRGPWDEKYHRWWMNTRDGPGWFFRKQFEDTLVAHGARRTTLLSGPMEPLPSYNTHVRFSDEDEDLDVLLREVQGDDDEDDASDPDYTPDHREEQEYIHEEYIEDPVASDAGPVSEDEQDVTSVI